MEEWMDENLSEAYTGLAQVYDSFMDNVPYDAWSRFVISELKKRGIENCLAAELGCGTGVMTELLSDAGYDMIGIDNSEEMLEVAQEKRMESVRNILYLLQDMREFELYGTVGAIISVCDCVNYVTEPEELLEVFRLADNYLDPDGIFLFDFNTAYKYKEVLGTQTIAENRENTSFIWDNYYDEETRMNEYELAVFVREPGMAPSLYRKYEEIHYQRGYELEEIKMLLDRAGLIFEAAYDGYTNSPVTDRSERICVIARESGRKKRELEMTDDQ